MRNRKKNGVVVAFEMTNFCLPLYVNNQKLREKFAKN